MIYCGFFLLAEFSKRAIICVLCCDVNKRVNTINASRKTGGKELACMHAHPQAVSGILAANGLARFPCPFFSVWRVFIGGVDVVHCRACVSQPPVNHTKAINFSHHYSNLSAVLSPARLVYGIIVSHMRHIAIWHVAQKCCACFVHFAICKL